MGLISLISFYAYVALCSRYVTTSKHLHLLISVGQRDKRNSLFTYITEEHFKYSGQFSSFVPCHHGISCSRDADEGDGLQIWKVARNILNKQGRSDDKGGPSARVLDEGLTTSHPKKRES
jgi:hypothetical protein